MPFYFRCKDLSLTEGFSQQWACWNSFLPLRHSLRKSLHLQMIQRYDMQSCGHFSHSYRSLPQPRSVCCAPFLHFTLFSLRNTISITQHIHPFQLDWVHRYIHSGTQIYKYWIILCPPQHLTRPKGGEGALLEGLISQPPSGGTPVCVIEQGSVDSKSWNPGTRRAEARSVSLPVFYNAQAVCPV